MGGLDASQAWGGPAHHTQRRRHPWGMTLSGRDGLHLLQLPGVTTSIKGSLWAGEKAGAGQGIDVSSGESGLGQAGRGLRGGARLGFSSPEITPCWPSPGLGSPEVGGEQGHVPRAGV